MRAGLLTGVCAALLALGPGVATGQENKAAKDNQEPAADEARQEAKRQSVSAIKGQSPPQTVRQAIAFERFKERAAARQARIEARHPSVSNSTADRGKQEAAPDRKKDQ